MNILFVGSTGFLGKSLLPLLLKDGRIERITLVTHQTPFIMNTNNIDTISCDDFFLSERTYPRYEAVICLSGRTSSQTRDKKIMRESNIDVPIKMIDYSKRHKVDHFIFASSINVRLASSGGYAQYKREAEAYLVSSGVPYTIFRPALIFGKGDAVLSKIISFIQTCPIMPVFGNGRKYEQPIHVTEAAMFFYQATVSPPKNEIIEIGGFEAMKYDEMLKIIADYYKRKIHILHLPVKPFLSIAAFCEKSGIPLPLTSEQIEHIDTDLAIDNSLALRRYQVVLHPFEEWLKKQI